MNVKLVKQLRDNDILRKSFIKLSKDIFDISFESWYENGYWTDRYITYSVVCGDTVVSNASVNIIDTLWNGENRRYVQIGTVMTDEKYRNRGFSRKIIEEILSDWKDRCDLIYLYANNTVLDFYPKFGFEKANEYQCIIPVEHKMGDFRKLNMERDEDLQILKRCYNKSNPFSKLPMVGCTGLLMFYFAGFSLSTMLSEFASDLTEKVVLGFTPKDSGDISSCIYKKLDDDDCTLFVLKEKDNIFKDNRVMMPLLSHA